MNFPKAKYPTRYVFAQRMTERGATDSEFVVFESDLAKSTYSYLFREKYPERYFDMGIAEAEVNPLLILPEGQGVMAVDALVFQRA